MHGDPQIEPGIRTAGDRIHIDELCGDPGETQAMDPNSAKETMRVAAVAPIPVARKSRVLTRPSPLKMASAGYAGSR